MTHPGGAAPRESDEVRRVSDQIAGRLASRNVRLSGHERPEELALLEEAVERFEAAVEGRGGDLMMDEGPLGQVPQPDDPHFTLPKRNDDESVVRYLERIARATDDVRHHSRRAAS
jgi:hypothetical protein